MMGMLKEQGMITDTGFDEEIEWTGFTFGTTKAAGHVMAQRCKHRTMSNGMVCMKLQSGFI